MSTLKRVFLATVAVVVIAGSGSPPVRGATGTPLGGILQSELRRNMDLLRGSRSRRISPVTRSTICGPPGFRSPRRQYSPRAGTACDHVKSTGVMPRWRC